MRRGTTPDYLLTVAGYDLTKCTVYVTLKQGPKIITVSGERLSVSWDADANTSSVTFGLTQEDTLGLKQGNAEIQIRFINANGEALATQIRAIPVLPVLFEEVIEYDP